MAFIVVNYIIIVGLTTPACICFDISVHSRNVIFKLLKILPVGPDTLLYMFKPIFEALLPFGSKNADHAIYF